MKLYGYTLDPYQRIQKGMRLDHAYPYRYDGKCACGCKERLIGRQKRWASKDCVDKVFADFSVIYGNGAEIRDRLFIKDGGYCNHCGDYDDNWQADHIIPVHKGGGACGMDNFQTLCVNCHKIKTINEIDARNTTTVTV